MFSSFHERIAAVPLKLVAWLTLLGMLAVAIVSLCMGVSYPAHAQDVADATTTFDFGPILDAILDVLAPTIVGIASMLGVWCLERLGKWLGLKIDERRAQTISDGLQHAAAFGLAQARLKVGQGLRVDLRSDAITSAATYAEHFFPDALKHFNVTPTKLEKMVEARLGPMLQEPVTSNAGSNDAASPVSDIRAVLRTAPIDQRA